MKITRHLLDNGMDIMHVKYSKAEIKAAVERIKAHKAELEKKKEEEKKQEEEGETSRKTKKGTKRNAK
jgi:hypothetical protein